MSFQQVLALATQSRLTARANMRGFTLIEFLVVVAIVAILTGISLILANNIKEAGSVQKQETKW